MESVPAANPTKQTGKTDKSFSSNGRPSASKRRESEASFGPRSKQSIAKKASKGSKQAKHQHHSAILQKSDPESVPAECSKHDDNDEMQHDQRLQPEQVGKTLLSSSEQQLIEQNSRQFEQRHLTDVSILDSRFSMDSISDRAQASIQDNDTGDDFRKQSHCEIEKRRRDKMNHYIMQLATMIPSFNNNSSKFDKLTVLRMAVQHVKSMRSSLCSFSSFHMRPPFLSSGNLLKNLILQMASQEAQDNLFMVVTCERGKVIFVSQSSRELLNQDQDELVGQCLFDMLHKDDVTKVKEQISYFDIKPKEMLVDSKTLQPIKNSHQRQTYNQLQGKSASTPSPGARRSFFCRMRIGPIGLRESSKTSDSHSTPSSLTSNSPPSTSSSSFPSSLSPPSPVSSSSMTSSSLSKNHKVRSDNREWVKEPLQSSLGQHNIGSNGTETQPDCQLNSSTAPSLPTLVGKKHKKQRDQPQTPICPTPDQGFPVPTLLIHQSESAAIHESRANLTDKQCEEAGAQQVARSACNRSKRDSSSKTNTKSGSSASNSSTTQLEASSHKSKFIADRDKSNSAKAPNQKHSNKPQVSLKTNSSAHKRRLRYLLMHCTGYLRTVSLGLEEFEEDDEDFDECMSDKNTTIDNDFRSSREVMCLVAVCRRSPMDLELKPDRPLTFTCRYSMEGKFVFVDQKTTIALGYTPQQLLGTSHYAYCHKDSVNTFKECHRQSILKSEPVSSDIYQFKRANGQSLWLQTSLRSFRNPWTKFIDYIVASHTTAESNDPIYNDGCVSRKFRRDVTRGGSQSSSPISSSSLSSDSKKSTSPSSSSIESSISIDSNASNASIQALLHHIDRVKSGGIKHALNFNKKNYEFRLTKRGPVSANKSTDDSGAYSDPHSCSSLSSHNSGNSTASAEFANRYNIGNYIDFSHNQAPSNMISNTYYSQQKPSVAYRQSNPPCPQPNYPTASQQVVSQQTNISCPVSYVSGSGSSSSARASKVFQRDYRPLHVQPKQAQKAYDGHDYQYGSMTKPIATNTQIANTSDQSWPAPSLPLYGCQQDQRVELDVTAPVRVIIPDLNTVQDNACQPTGGLNSPRAPYIIHPVEASVNLVPGHKSISDQLPTGSSRMNPETYDNGMLPVNSYINTNISSHYAGQSLEQMQPGVTPNIQPHITSMTMQPHQVRSQPVDDIMSITMMYNGTEESNYREMNSDSADQQGQILNSVGGPNYQIIAQPLMQCQQCANHRCNNQNSMATGNTDLNSINLTSLAVEGDLDEDQLLEYLAGCDPESQFYNLQNYYHAS